MSYFPPTGSVVAFQSVPTNLVGTVSVVSSAPASVSGVGTFAVTQSGAWATSIVGVPNPHSVSGVGVFQIFGSTSIVGVPQPHSVSGVGIFNIAGSVAATGSVTTLQGTNPWVVGNSSVMLASGLNTVGSIATLQGTNPWVVQTTGSVLNQYREDVAATSVVGVAHMFRLVDGSSIMATVSPLRPLPVVGSVSGTVATNPNPASVQLLGGTNAIGSVAVLQGTNPWTVQTTGSVIVFSTGSVATRSAPASVQLIGGNALIGSVAQAGNWFIQPASVQLIAGTNIAGSIATLQGTNPWIIGNSSVTLMNSGNSIGSVTTLQGTNPWIITGGAATGTLTSVKSSISTVSILSTNTSRKGATIYNTAGTILFVNLGTSAQTSVYTVGLNANDYYELPFGYNGVVAGITASNAGLISVNELT